MRIPIHLRVAGSFILVAAISLLIGGTLLQRRVADEVRSEIETRVTQEAKLLAEELAQHAVPEAEADAWADSKGKTISSRVTLIAEDGRVVGDSELTTEQVRTIENHGSRPEVLEAKARGIGQASRYSTTLHQDMLYVAMRVPQGFVRVAMPLDRVAAAVGDIRTSLVLAALLALATAAVVSYLAARRVTHPVEEITERALEIARGQFEGRIVRQGDDELRDLGEAMNRLAVDMAEHVQGLRDESARLRAVLDGMAEGVMVTDDDGRIAMWNESFGRLFPGIPPQGRRPIEVVRSAELQDTIRDAAREPAPVSREITIGDRVFIVRVARIQRDVGPSERIVAVLHDVTEMRRGERMRRDFVANASHELRTPIATVRAAAETLLAAESLPDAPRRFADMIHRQSQRMGTLVDDMLRLSELESSYKPQPKMVDMHIMVDQVLAAARTRVAAKRTLSLDQKIDGNVAALVDPAAIEQILTNLVDNACKYTPDGGRIEVRARNRNGNVVVEVRDTGPGIPPQHLPRLFERFYRVDSGRAREHGGTGLGLAIVKHLVLANRGTVSVESELGRGSTFTVKLPRAGV
jgi:two-component system phosphate regulon sensor histidine kinase PhoR